MGLYHPEAETKSNIYLELRREILFVSRLRFEA